MTKILKSTFKLLSIEVFTLLVLLLLFIQSCKKSDSTDGKLLQASNSVESKILALLPSEFFDNGYSRSGLLDGDAQIFFTKDALNVSYLIMGQQEVMEKGIPLNIHLVTNRSGQKILKGEWDNQTAGDGIFIVYLDKGNVGVQIEGQNGANWLYRAEKKVDKKLYEKLSQLFYGNVNYKQASHKDNPENKAVTNLITEDSINDTRANESSDSNSPKLLYKTVKIFEKIMTYTQCNIGAHDCGLEFKDNSGELHEFFQNDINNYDFECFEGLKYKNINFRIKYRRVYYKFENYNETIDELIWISKQE